MMYAIVDMHFDDRGRYLYAALYYPIYEDLDTAYVVFWNNALSMVRFGQESVILGDYLVIKVFPMAGYNLSTMFRIEVLLCIDAYDVDLQGNIILSDDDILNAGSMLENLLGRS